MITRLTQSSVVSEPIGGVCLELTSLRPSTSHDSNGVPEPPNVPESAGWEVPSRGKAVTCRKRVEPWCLAFLVSV